MTLIETEFKDLYLIKNPVHADDRGIFFKPFDYNAIFDDVGDFDPKEIYYSVNHKNVIRGMHFQIPPEDHSKLVWVSVGSVMDVVLDIRKNSVTYGNWYARKLSPEEGIAILIPRGFAHGFLSLEEGSVVNYAQTSNYNKLADKGILFSSFGYNWHELDPIISIRDKSFQKFCDFSSDFL